MLVIKKIQIVFQFPYLQYAQTFNLLYKKVHQVKKPSEFPYFLAKKCGKPLHGMITNNINEILLRLSLILCDT